MSQQALYDKLAARVEEGLEYYSPNLPIRQAKLLEAMSYSLTAGGKRVRPVLLLAFCRAVGGDVEQALPFACALEMIHTYSLIHDDLPCMDDDEMRRGRPTNHRIFGEATALLAGDALHSAAFETMLNPENLNGLDPMRALRAAYAVAWAAGPYGMAGGQLLDMEAEGLAVDLETAGYIHNLKTGALFRAAAEAGCILGGASDVQLRSAATFSECLALAFQIKDDLLNVEGDARLLGKRTGTDAVSEKMTFVRVLGLEESRRQVETLTQRGLQEIGVFADAELLRHIALSMAERQR